MVFSNKKRSHIVDLKSTLPILVLLYVIPAPYQVRGKLQQESSFFFTVLDSRLHGNDNSNGI